MQDTPPVDSQMPSTDAMAQMVADLMKKGMPKEQAMKKAAQMMIGDNLKATMGPGEEMAEGTPNVTDSPAEDMAEGDPSAMPMDPNAMPMDPAAMAGAPGAPNMPAPGSPEDMKRKAMIAEMVKMGLK